VTGIGDRWPFGTTDGAPASRPNVVDMEGVLIAILRDDAAGEQARAMLCDRGFDDDALRLYRAEQIVAYDDEFRTGRSLTGKIVGAVVDDRVAMSEYVLYGREGCSALWVLVPERDDANSVVRWLADEDAVFVWYHWHGRVEAIPLRDRPGR
jgi:hypothetical protein